jgi:GTPase SAR1 family protein
MENINIAVLGTAQVGKSTLIQRALDLRGLPSTPVSGQKMSVDNVIYRVSLIELGLDSVKFHPDHPIQWPLQILGQKIPRMDGSLLLYDVMNRASIIDIPQILSESSFCTKQLRCIA